MAVNINMDAYIICFVSFQNILKSVKSSSWQNRNIKKDRHTNSMIVVIQYGTPREGTFGFSNKAKLTFKK